MEEEVEIRHLNADILVKKEDGKICKKKIYFKNKCKVSL